MAVQLLTMAVAQFFDFGTFVVMVRQHGGGAEANPLVASILDDFGIPGVAIGAGVVGGWTNALTIRPW